MDEIFQELKEILERDADFLVENPDEIENLSKIGNTVEKKVIDHRFLQIKMLIDSVENKDDEFYAKLIQDIAIYIDLLYDREIDFCKSRIINDDERVNRLDSVYYNSYDKYDLKSANRDLAEELFEFICIVLDEHKDIKLDVDTIKRLINRNPKLYSLSVEESYIDRLFDFNKLCSIIKRNGTLKKSGISIDEVYQLLIDTFQINQEEIFKELIDPEEYRKDHKKVDEFLAWCNARTFVEVTDIIRENYDKDYDRFSSIKKRNKNKFCENVIIELLSNYASEEDYFLIRQILTDPEIEIDYNLYMADYSGQTDLKSMIALSGNPLIIGALLSKEQNVQDSYWHGDHYTRLYILYAMIGQYDKALDCFEKTYEFKNDLDEDQNWDRSGFAYGSWGYEDSLARFIGNLCTSLQERCVDYEVAVAMINRVLNNEKVKYVNLNETLTPIREILSSDDFKSLVDTLLERHNSNGLEFLTVNEIDEMYERYKISIATEDEIQEDLESFKREKRKDTSPQHCAYIITPQES